MTDSLNILDRPNGYDLEFNSAVFNPADATTYFLGSNFSLGPTTTTGLRKLFIPRAGRITKCNIFVVCTVGSNEQSTISIRLNNTTDTAVVTTLDLSSAVVSVTNTNLNIVVADGYTDFIEMKWVTPTWVATNPTNVTLTGCIFVAT